MQKEMERLWFNFRSEFAVLHVHQDGVSLGDISCDYDLGCCGLYVFLKI